MDGQVVSLSPHEATEIAGHLMAAKMYNLASCVMLFYDMFITFGDEVEKIWKQKFTVATVLWFMNRYLSPLGYIVVLVCKGASKIISLRHLSISSFSRS